jgi:hypothetical protein
MIDIALQYVRAVLDQHFSNLLGQSPGGVVLHGLSNTDSGLPDRKRNKLVITLVKLEYETNRQYSGAQKWNGAQYDRLNPPLYFNLDILVSANFDDYTEALRQLTLVIAFFQENLTLDRSSDPAMPEGLGPLKFEIENSASEQTHNLWTALGVSYLPSIVYKIRHVSVHSDQIKGTSPAVVAAIGSVGQ